MKKEKEILFTLLSYLVTLLGISKTEAKVKLRSTTHSVFASWEVAAEPAARPHLADAAVEAALPRFATVLGLEPPMRRPSRLMEVLKLPF